jgi:hypothetical protein
MNGAIHELVVSRLIFGSRLGRAGGPVGLHCLYVGFPYRESGCVLHIRPLTRVQRALTVWSAAGVGCCGGHFLAGPADVCVAVRVCMDSCMCTEVLTSAQLSE